MIDYEFGYAFEFKQYGERKYRSVADAQNKVRLGQVIVTKGCYDVPDGTKGVVYDIEVNTIPVHASDLEGKHFRCKLGEIDWEATMKLWEAKKRRS